MTFGQPRRPLDHLRSLNGDRGTEDSPNWEAILALGAFWLGLLAWPLA